MSVTLVALGDQTNNYSFSAASLAAALQQMTRLGPSDGDGHHAAACDIQAMVLLQGLQIGIAAGSAREAAGAPAEYRWSATAQITQASLGYKAIFLFPRWTNVSSLSRPIQNEWQRYTGPLWQHERGHVRVAIPVLRRYIGQFERLRIAGAGRTRQAAEEAATRDFRAQIPEVFRLLGRDTQQAGNSYDRRTRHGRTQGAQLRTRPPRGSRH